MPNVHRHVLRFCGALTLCCAFAVSTVAAQEAEAAEGRKKFPIQIPNIFSSELPQTLGLNDVRLSLRPHLGDFFSQDNLSLTLGARYGITSQLEVGTDLDAYFSHGFGSTQFFETYGLSRVRLRSKYKFTEFMRPFWETAAGINYSTPVSHPPEELIDGLRHFTPYFTMSHTLESRPDLSLFINYAVDLVDDAGLTTDFGENTLTDHNWKITPGAVLQRGDLTYTLEFSYASTAGFSEESRYVASVRPGVTWDIPPRYKFNARTNWIVGLGLRVEHGSDGGNIGFSVKVRTDIDLKRFLKKKKDVEPTPAE